MSDLAFSPDGRELYSGSFDGSLRRWDVWAHFAKGILRRDQGAILSLALAPDGLTLAFYSTAVNPRTKTSRMCFLDLVNGSVEAVDSPSTASIWSLAYAHDGKTLAEAGGADHRLRIWDAATRRVQTILPAHSSWDRKLCFSPVDHRLATSSLDGTLRLWDTSAGREWRGNRACRQMSFPRSRAMAIFLRSHATDEIRLWNLATGDVRKIPTAPSGQRDSLAYARDGRILASGGEDGTVRLWETETGRPVAARRNRGVEGEVAPGHSPTSVGLGRIPGYPYCVVDRAGRAFVRGRE